MSNIAIDYLLANIIASESDPMVINTIFDLVSDKDLQGDQRLLMSALRETWQKYNLIEPVALFGLLEAKHKQDTAKRLMIKYNDLMSCLISDSYWKHYLSQALLAIKTEKVKQLGRSLADEELNSARIDEMLIEFKSEIDRISNQYSMKTDVSLGSLADDYLKQLDIEAQDPDAGVVRTGLPYEQFIDGFRPGDFIILAARPKMGKSAFANTLMIQAAIRGKRVMYVSNEMDNRIVLNRLISTYCGISIKVLNSSHKSEADMTRIMDAIEQVRKLPIHLYCICMKKPSEILTEALRLADIGMKPDLIIVDYLQLFKPKNNTGTRYEIVTELSWEFKDLANTLQTPVLALSQLNRSLESRDDKRPKPSDLRESGALEQDATAIMSIYRDEVYYENTINNIAEIEVLLNRNGETGKHYYLTDFDNMKFSPIDDVFAVEIKDKFKELDKIKGRK